MTASHDCGSSADKVFVRTSPGYSLDDVIFLPGFIDFSLDAVQFQTALSRRSDRLVQLQAPLISHPSVTGAAMATAMALMGGLGIVGGATVEEQMAEIGKVKRFENGFINDPVTLPPTATVAQVDDIKRRYGFSTVPVVDHMHKLLGLITSRDIDFISANLRQDTRLDQVMTPIHHLITRTFPVSLAEANTQLRTAKVGKLPIIDDHGKLISLVSRNDLLKNKDYPLASKDANKQLLVGAAVQVENAQSIAQLVAAGADVVLLQGRVAVQVEVLSLTRTQYPQTTFIASNVASIAEIQTLADAGVDAIVVSRTRAQATGIYQLAAFARSLNVAVIGDPDVRNSGQIVKSLGLGAAAVLIERLFAGTTENVSADEGKGPVAKMISYYLQGAKHGFQDLGARSIEALHQMLVSGTLRMEIRSKFAVKEGNVHDLMISDRKQPLPR